MRKGDHAAKDCVAAFMCVPLVRSQTYPLGEVSMGFTVLNNEYGTDLGRINVPGQGSIMEGAWLDEA